MNNFGKFSLWRKLFFIVFGGSNPPYDKFYYFMRSTVEQLKPIRQESFWSCFVKCQCHRVR